MPIFTAYYISAGKAFASTQIVANTNHEAMKQARMIEKEKQDKWKDIKRLLPIELFRVDRHRTIWDGGK